MTRNQVLRAFRSLALGRLPKRVRTGGDPGADLAPADPYGTMLEAVRHLP